MKKKDIIVSCADSSEQNPTPNLPMADNLNIESEQENNSSPESMVLKSRLEKRIKDTSSKSHPLDNLLLSFKNLNMKEKSHSGPSFLSTDPKGTEISHSDPQGDKSMKSEIQGLLPIKERSNSQVVSNDSKSYHSNHSTKNSKYVLNNIRLSLKNNLELKSGDTPQDIANTLKGQATPPKTTQNNVFESLQANFEKNLRERSQIQSNLKHSYRKNSQPKAQPKKKTSAITRFDSRSRKGNSPVASSSEESSDIQSPSSDSFEKADSFTLSSCSSDESYRKTNPEKVLLGKMEMFYDNNFRAQDISQECNVGQKRVWNVVFDYKFDIVYLVVAYVKFLHTDQAYIRHQYVRDLRSHRRMAVLNSSEMSPFMNILAAKLEDPNRKKVPPISQLPPQTVYYLELELQVWNLEDYQLRDKSEPQKPISQFKILEQNVPLPTYLNSHEVMWMLQNKFQDYAQLLQDKGRIFIFSGNDSMIVYDVREKSIRTKKVHISQGDKKIDFNYFVPRFFKKDLGRRTESIESIHVLAYYQSEPDEMKALSDRSINLKDLMENENIAETTQQKKTSQKLIFRSYVYKTLELKKKVSHQVICAQNTVNLHNESLASYYRNDNKRNLKSLFFIRIADSSTYIVLFPTGLLLLVSSSSFSIQAKLQLNLKKDESIIDVSYCVQDSGKNHCLWLMDEKLQIWKCYNELVPNSCDWTLTKITNTFDNLYHKRFLHVSMSYEDYFVTTSLQGIQCLKNLGLEEPKQFDFLFAFNDSSTKALIVKQASLRTLTDTSLFNLQGDSKDVSPTRSLEDQGQITMIVVNKHQQQIMNRILELRSLKDDLAIKLQNQMSQATNNIKDEQNSKTVKLLGSLNYNKNLIKKQIQQIMQNEIVEKFKKHNEVKEILFLGKIPASKKHKISKLFSKTQGSLRYYLIHRQFSLELLYTDGRMFRVDHIQGTQVSSPLILHQVFYTKETRTLTVVYCQQRNEHQNFIRVFRRQGYDFVIVNEKLELGNSNLRNVFINMYGQVSSLQVDVIRTEYKPDGQTMSTEPIVEKLFDFLVTISIPKIIVKYELFDKNNYLQRLTTLCHGRILICGCVLIKLSKALDEMENLGVVILHKDHSVLHYKFYSLLDPEKRALIYEYIRKHPKGVIRFSAGQKPLNPLKWPNVLYFTHCFDENTGESSLIKMQIETLECFEVYQTRQRIIKVQLLQTQGSKDQKIVNAPSINADDLWSKNLKPTMSSISSKMRAPSLMRKESSSLIPKQDQQEATLSDKVEVEDRISMCLISYNKHSINLEIIHDKEKTVTEEDGDASALPEVELKTPNLSVGASSKMSLSVRLRRKITQVSQAAFMKKDIQKKLQIPYKCTLETLVSIEVKKEIVSSLEVGWITNSQLLLILGQEFFMINLRVQELVSVKSGLKYGLQRVNKGLFCSLVTKADRKKGVDESIRAIKHLNDVKHFYISEQKRTNKINMRILDAMRCIQRMEIASLKKYSFLKLAQASEDLKKSLLFFTPSEELNGGNIFSRVSGNFKIIQPYLEVINGDFVKLMNQHVSSIISYIYPDDGRTQEIHMYQQDIMGSNAIDYAFSKNAIFCIKAFVDTLMNFPDEVQFRNCFDKAILLMINRGMDVKDLVNSHLFYGTIWSNQALFSGVKEPVILAYNGDLEDLEIEDPYLLFSQMQKRPEVNLEKKGISQLTRELKSLPSMLAKAPEPKIKEEQFEMQYNYIYMEEIQGENKIEISSTLKDCDDIELFEQEPIQHIIDYKWDTYARDFFWWQFFLYAFYIVTFYMDMNSLYEVNEEGHRVKGFMFWACKIIGLVIQTGFLIYEFIQFMAEKKDYVLDPQNYLELVGITIYAWAAFLDMKKDDLTDLMKILYSGSVLFNLIKIVYLMRVFRQLNFLVTMFITVVNEIFYFMILFSLFLLTFAESFHIVDVDISSYGRTPSMFAHTLGMLRCAMGDFSVIDPFEGFDRIADPNAEEDSLKYKHSFIVVQFTFVLYIIAVFYLFMIFMNFIIAVIGESYSKVIQNKEAFDYLQRATMIYEREVHFQQKHFENQQYFPSILIVRKLKETHFQAKSNWQGFLSSVKASIGTHFQKCIEAIATKSKEQNQHFGIQVRSLENEILNFGKDISRVHTDILKHLRMMLFEKKRTASSGTKSKSVSHNSLSSSSSEQVNIFQIKQQDTVKRLSKFTSKDFDLETDSLQIQKPKSISQKGSARRNRSVSPDIQQPVSQGASPKLPRRGGFKSSQHSMNQFTHHKQQHMKYSSYDSGMVQSGHSFDRNTLLPPKRNISRKNKKKTRRSREASPEAEPRAVSVREEFPMQKIRMKKQTKSALKAENFELRAQMNQVLKNQEEQQEMLKKCLTQQAAIQREAAKHSQENAFMKKKFLSLKKDMSDLKDTLAAQDQGPLLKEVLLKVNKLLTSTNKQEKAAAPSGEQRRAVAHSGSFEARVFHERPMAQQQMLIQEHNRNSRSQMQFYRTTESQLMTNQSGLSVGNSCSNSMNQSMGQLLTQTGPSIVQPPAGQLTSQQICRQNSRLSDYINQPDYMQRLEHIRSSQRQGPSGRN